MSFRRDHPPPETDTIRMTQLKPKTITDMKQEIKTRTIIAPQPVLIVATYDADGVADAMNVAWGGQCWDNEVALNISSNHKTTENLRQQMAFTLSIGTVDTMREADYFGIVSGKKENKIDHLGLKTTKANEVNAPLIDIFPLVMECEVESMTDNGDEGVRVVARIRRTVADSSILDKDGKVDYSRLNPIMYDSETHAYYSLGEKVGHAFHDGADLK